MKEKRRQHQERIRQENEERARRKELLSAEDRSHGETTQDSNIENADEAAISEVFTEVIGRGGHGEASKPKTSNKIDKAEERRREKARNFVAYSAADFESEKQLALDKVDFARQADGATVEIFADDDKGLYKQKHAKRWDRKKKRFVGPGGDGQDIKRIRTEDGTWLPASYKTGRYEDWKKKQKIGYRKARIVELLVSSAVCVILPQPVQARNPLLFLKRTMVIEQEPGHLGPKSELRNVSQIKKIRKKSAKLQEYMEHRRQENLKKKANRASGAKHVGGKRKK
ncbi:DBP10CT domain protein [Cooperia oncophora]